MEPKRRLPVIKSTGGDAGDADADPIRPGWQWVAFGALAIFVVWLPLAWLSTLASLRLEQVASGPALAAGVFLASAAGLAGAALAGGYLIGRWGAPGVGVREASLAGLAAAVLAMLLAWRSGLSLSALATVAIAVPPAALGGRLGLRRRR
jgi:hypothetical protein